MKSWWRVPTFSTDSGSPRRVEVDGFELALGLHHGLLLGFTYRPLDGGVARRRCEAFATLALRYQQCDQAAQRERKQACDGPGQRRAPALLAQLTHPLFHGRPELIGLAPVSDQQGGLERAAATSSRRVTTVAPLHVRLGFTGYDHTRLVDLNSLAPRRRVSLTLVRDHSGVVQVQLFQTFVAVLGGWLRAHGAKAPYSRAMPTTPATDPAYWPKLSAWGTGQFARSCNRSHTGPALPSRCGHLLTPRARGCPAVIECQRNGFGLAISARDSSDFRAGSRRGADLSEDWVSGCGAADRG